MLADDDYNAASLKNAQPSVWVKKMGGDQNHQTSGLQQAVSAEGRSQNRSLIGPAFSAGSP